MNQLSFIQQQGQVFEGFALVKDSQIGQAKNHSWYMSIVLSDKHTSIPAKLWENQFLGHSVEEVQRIFKRGHVVFVKATASLYQQDIQLTIQQFRLANETEYKLEDFLSHAPEPIEQMQKEVEDTIASMKNETIREVCYRLYVENKKAFSTYPAAKANHHAFIGGLLYHTVSMLRIAKHLTKQYQHIHEDLLYAGVILHDMGKVVELSSPVAPEYTKEGNLLGHIHIVSMMIDRVMQKLKTEKGQEWKKEDSQVVYELQHIVLSHHGKKEWGSPVEPHTLEAELLHHIDMIDSRVNMITDGLKDKNKEEAHHIRPLGMYYHSFSGKL